MAKRPLWPVTVVNKRPLAPHPLRLELEGPTLDAFPEGSEGGYVKLLLSRERPGEAATEAETETSIKRSYTIRAVDRVARTLTLDCVVHDVGGPATTWIRTAQVGSRITVTGPGPVSSVDPTADWVFLAGDLTALPAMAANLERLPAGTRGYAVVGVDAPEDAITLAKPDGVALHWAVRSPNDDPASSELVRQVRDLPWLPGRVSAWAASEFSEMKALRHYFRDEKALPKEDLYISSYWKRGDTDEQHKAAKQADPDAK